MKLVEDREYKNMWRVKYDDGTVSDMVNKSRAEHYLWALKQEMALRATEKAAGEFCTLSGTTLHGTSE